MCFFFFFVIPEFVLAQFSPLQKRSWAVPWASPPPSSLESPHCPWLRPHYGREGDQRGAKREMEVKLSFLVVLGMECLVPAEGGWMMDRGGLGRRAVRLFPGKQACYLLLVTVHCSPLNASFSWLRGPVLSQPLPYLHWAPPSTPHSSPCLPLGSSNQITFSWQILEGNVYRPQNLEGKGVRGSPASLNQEVCACTYRALPSQAPSLGALYGPQHQWEWCRVPVFWTSLSTRASQVVLVVKDLPVNARDVRDPGSIPG